MRNNAYLSFTFYLNITKGLKWTKQCCLTFVSIIRQVLTLCWSCHASDILFRAIVSIHKESVCFSWTACLDHLIVSENPSPPTPIWHWNLVLVVRLTVVKTFWNQQAYNHTHFMQWLARCGGEKGGGLWALVKLLLELVHFKHAQTFKE